MVSTVDSNICPVAVHVRCRSALDKTYKTEVGVGTYSTPARVFSAIKWLGICWALAVFFIFVPILHFVLVPAAALLGLFMFAQRLMLREFMAKGEVRCPNCSHAVEVKPGGFGWPKREICSGCRSDVFLEKA